MIKQRILFLFMLLMAFGTISFAKAKSGKTNALKERLITIDANKIKGDLNLSFKACVGAGRAHEGLDASWQKQLLETKKDCDFQRIRFHGLLCDEMGLYHEDKTGIHLNFQYIDSLFDYLVSIGVVPFVELGFMPEGLKSGNETIFWWKGNVTPPSDYNKWGEFIKKFVSHLKERYSEETIANWYFEVWNEPNLTGFFNGTQEQYFELYKTTAQAIKSVSSRFKVGGPATAGCGWVPEFMDYCLNNNVTLDFITTHHYGVEGYLDEFGVQQLYMPVNFNGISSTINSLCDKVREKKDMEVHFTEWSSSYSPRDPFHDVYQNAPYVLNTLKRVEGGPSSMSYWTFTDIFEEPGPTPSPFHGGFGLMNFEGIKKPTYFAYKFLNELGHTELMNTDSCSWTTTDKKGNYQVLFWNIEPSKQGKESNQIYYKKDLPSHSIEKTTVSLNNIMPGKYYRELYRIGYKINDCYTAYYEMGSPENLTSSQCNALKDMSNGSACSKEIVEINKDGQYNETFTVRDNDVFFIKLYKLD